MIEPRRPTPQRGRVRSARLTDLSAVGELSRLAHAVDGGSGETGAVANNGTHGGMRTLGLPLGTGPISAFSLFRMPLGAFLPSDLIYVYEERGAVVGLARVEHESMRDEWTIVELVALDNGTAGDIRFRLVQHLLRDASKRGGLRFHVACADAGGNVELFMQAGFARYGEERILYRSPDQSFPEQMTQANAQSRGIRTAVSLDANELDRLYRAATPAPVVRLEDYRLPDWERQGNHWRVPRSALTPLLRFADVEAFVQQSPQGEALLAFCQIGVAKEEHPDYLRVISRPDHDASELISFSLAQINEQVGRHRLDWARLHRSDRGVVSAVRTYEAPLDRRLEDCGFGSVAVVSLLMKEVAERVREPALVPVASR
ncbi:MAG: hypothetical protein ABI797_07260 [Chloroflexota bacterium]